MAARYEILRLLGSGGSAVVYAVRDRKIGDEIALKLLREGNRSDVDVERSRREAEFARVSDSPRLVRTFDLSESDGLVYLTMELVPGGSLRDLVRRGPLPVDEVIRLADEILEALADLHRLDVVHRDLKPGNLLLTADGHIKLSDFGIARKWTDEQSRLTMTGLPVGTVDYLSPEQASAEKVDPRSDLYSLGVVLFEMLTGRVPFEAPSAVSAAVLRLHRRAENVRKLRRDIPRWLAAIVARLLETKREDRYGSAEEALVDLRRKRARRRLKPRRIAILLLILLVECCFAVRQFVYFGHPQLVAIGDSGLRVIDEDGDTLWTHPQTTPSYAAVVHRGWRTEVAAILTSSHSAFARTLTFFDARTGQQLRTRRLPSAASAFPDFSDYFGAAQVLATDLNADGYDEVAVTYVHDFWPSYIVMHDLRRDEARTVLISSGHHRIEGTEDVDGDGVAELIVSGMSNKMGWYHGLAAIGVSLDSPPTALTFTPDREDWPHSPSLIWYALAPPGMLNSQGITVDRKRRILHMNYGTPLSAPVVMTFDGFAANSSSSLSPAQRKAAREQAYEHLREAKRLIRRGDGPGAVDAATAAQNIARRIGDAWLEEWSGRQLGTAMAQAGQVGEASAFFGRLGAGSQAAADIAFDAGTAFHLAGELPRAVDWYRQALGRKSHPLVGRQKYESIQGMVLALGEMGRWDIAFREIDAAIASYPGEADNAAWCRRYVAWRTGERPEVSYAEERPHDLYRYWALELMLARGENPEAMLKSIDQDRARTSETRTLLLLARAEALRRLGRTDDALQFAREAYQALRGQRRTDTLARAHFDLAAERLSSLAEASGFVAEAQQVRTEAAALRWHPNRMQD